MSETSPLVTFLMLTEDSSDEAPPVVIALTRAMLRLLDPRAALARIRFVPQDRSARDAIQGAKWKDRDPSRRVPLLRAVATEISRSNGFVVFHIDGDRRWSERETSDNLKKFDSLIRSGVRNVLTAHGRTTAQIDAVLTRLVLFCPFYSVESWLYQNTAVAVRLCRQRHGGRDVARFEAWQRDRSLLDEELRPKDNVCLAAKHNVELAETQYPAGEVREAGKSFAETVNALAGAHHLIDTLAALRLR